MPSARAEIAIRAGEVHLPATIEVDGRPRKVQVPWPDAASGLESVRIEFPPEIELDGLAWEARPRAGVAGVESGRAVPGGPPRPVDADGGGAASPRLAQDWTLPATSIRRIELAATARIPLDPATRDRVETSYRNRLALDRLRAASGRLVLVPLDEEAR